jgi:hypothetical protein
MAHLRLRLLLALTLVFVCPLPAPALEIHTLEITGGSMSFTMSPGVGTSPGPAHWDITGPRIALSTVQDQANSGSLFRCTLLGQFNCSPGTILQVGGGGGGGVFLGGSVTLDGVTHGLNAGGNDPRLDGGLALLISAPVLIPEFGSISSVVLTAPFVLTGTLGRTGLECFHPFFNPFACSGDTALSTTYQLHGQGVFYGAMHRENRSDFGDYWQTDSARYEFQAPEPATLLLFGTSAAGLGLARLTRRRMNCDAAVTQSGEQIVTAHCRREVG